jgi:hypothetical protein
MIIDGMEHAIYQSSDTLLKGTTFSGKKGYHTFTKLVGVNKEGKIWFLSKSFPGGISDSNLSQFEENQIYKQLEKEEKIAADLGFQGLEHLSILTNLSGKKTAEQKRFNRVFKHYRSVVENSITQIRNWKICSNKFDGKIKHLRQAREKHDFITRIVAKLVNKFVMPIRKYEEEK